MTLPDGAASIASPPAGALGAAGRERGRGPGGNPLRSAVPLLLALLTSACAGTPGPPPAAPRPPARSASLEEVLAAYDAYCREGTTLSASGHVDVRDHRTGRGRTLGVRLVAARGGRLYLKGSVAVVTALELVSDGQRFWFQVPSKKTVWTGPTAAEARDAEADDAPYYALRPGDVTAALLPEPLSAAAGEVLLLEGEPEAFTLTLAAPTGGGRGPVRRRVSLDRQTLRPVRLRGYDARGDLSADVVLAGWEMGEARRVSIRRPQEGYEASFHFDKVQRNVPAPERAFAPRTPEGYAVVEVR